MYVIETAREEASEDRELFWMKHFHKLGARLLNDPRDLRES